MKAQTNTTQSPAIRAARLVRQFGYRRALLVAQAETASAGQRDVAAILERSIDQARVLAGGAP